MISGCSILDKYEFLKYEKDSYYRDIISAVGRGC